jgi:hypothetical protein
MEQEILETVIGEMLGEQQSSNEKIAELSEKITGLNVQVLEFKSLLSNIKLEVPSVDTFRIEGILYDQHEIARKQLNELEGFIKIKRKEKEFREKAIQWLPWIFVVLLFTVIFRIAINCGNPI